MKLMMDQGPVLQLSFIGEKGKKVRRMYCIHYMKVDFFAISFLQLLKLTTFEKIYNIYG